MKKIPNISPLDPALCGQTVTVYHREGLTRRCLEGVHFECTRTLETDLGRAEASEGFLLVIPGADPIQPGDTVVLGEGPEVIARDSQRPTVESVKQQWFLGTVSHTEARGK